MSKWVLNGCGCVSVMGLVVGDPPCKSGVAGSSAGVRVNSERGCLPKGLSGL